MNKLRNLYFLCIPTLLGILSFIFVTGGEILWPSNINWLLLNVDTADGLYAWQFFRHTPIFQNPLGSNFPYGMEMGGSLIYAEPLFIFAFPFKIFSSVLPTTFQYQGLWILLCFILQANFAWKLQEKFINDLLIKLFGTTFFVLAPVLIWRLHCSVSFFSHWLILAAIFFYFSLNYQKYLWPMLLIISSLVHAYFLFMLLAIWGADLLNRWLFNELTLFKLLKYGIINFILVMLVIWQAGYLILHSGFEAGGLGYFRINILSFIDPTDGFGFNSWSHVLRNQPKIAGELYEGFMYLGSGMIILGLFGLPKLIDYKNIEKIFYPKKIFCLFFITFLLWMYALSTHVALGQRELFSYSLPEIFNVFRASGRMALPFYYLLYFGILYLIVKSYKRLIAQILIFICLAFQIIDSFNIFTNFRNLLTNVPNYVSLLKSPTWSEAAKKYKKIIYVFPTFDWNLFPLIHYAAFNRLSINIGYFARIDNAQLVKAKNKLTNDFVQGKLDQEAIYIIKDAAMRQMINNRNIIDPYKVARIDNFYLLMPNSSSFSTQTEKSDWSKSKQYEYGTNIIFGQTKNNNFSDYLVLINGWSVPEEEGIWTDGNRADFLITLPKKINSNLILTINAIPFINLKHPILNVDVLVNEKYIGRLNYKVNDIAHLKKIEIPNNVIEENNLLRIKFIFKDPIAPKTISSSLDIRKLALFVSSIIIDIKK